MGPTLFSYQHYPSKLRLKGKRIKGYKEVSYLKKQLSYKSFPSTTP